MPYDGVEHRPLRVLDDLRTWASADDNVRLLVLTGSLAREEGALDELSDLDIELYARDPQLLLDRRDWYHRFGEVRVVEELENPGWHPTRLIYYVDGKIDFMIAGVEAAKRGLGYDRPYRVLVDKDDLGKRLHAVPLHAGPPRAAEFSTCINCFYAAALMCARGIVRDEPWMAKVRDWDLKTQLLQMIEWDHKSRYGWDFDTWHLGIHMRQWMGRRHHREASWMLGRLLHGEYDLGIVRLSRPLRRSVHTYREYAATGVVRQLRGAPGDRPASASRGRAGLSLDATSEMCSTSPLDTVV